MKIRFNTIDIIAVLNELQLKVDMRVNQVYDIDNKTYLIKLGRHEEKATILIESGIRIHSTDYEWPKNPAPSGFTMKLRKHLKNKRLEKISQLGIDRIIDLQFGTAEVACHVILELYDRGNIVLTDHNYLILNILRPRAKGDEDVKLIVRETYPISTAKQKQGPLTMDKITSVLESAKNGDNLKRIFNPHVVYGAPLIEHALMKNGFKKNCQLGKTFDKESQMSDLLTVFQDAEDIFNELLNGKKCLGYIVQKIEKLNTKDEAKKASIFEDFSPIKFLQFENEPMLDYESFDKAVDTYFSNLEGQKIELKRFHKEKEAYKKLENIKKDHYQRIDALQKIQDVDSYKAQLIEANSDLIDTAILVIAHAIASQTSWDDIEELLQDARSQGDTIAKSIKSLKLDINHFVIALNDPYETDENGDSKPILVEIDLDLSAYANARKYYGQKKYAAKKEQKTIDASSKAYKSAEKKAFQTLKEIAVTAHITQARKTFWFEKFMWFVSSENYLVIAGRDVQQNELLVKRYLRAGDLYVHGDLHGAASVIIKNPSNKPVPPKTLNEAGTMAVCYSSAWDAKIVTSAWWVYPNQVSKTAPTGEYLSAGSFMIRGKKNYLPPCHLIMGFGFLFKLDEDSIERHKGERKVKIEEEDFVEIEEASISTAQEENEIELSENSNDEEEDSIEPTKADGDNATELAEPQTLEMIEESDEEESCFPDTELNLLSSKLEKNKLAVDGSTTFLGNDHPTKQTSKQSKIKNMPAIKEKAETTEIEQKTANKRRQKSKLKKIKEKYKDQDDEEREMRLQILGSAGTDSKSKKNKKLKEKSQPNKSKNRVKNPGNAGVCLHTDLLHVEELGESQPIEAKEEEDSDIEDPEENTKMTEDARLLESLTGAPTSEDTLIFALPVCAPYGAMQSYKYKVKAMPGTGKRGKAGKTALNVFINDKSATNREKDLLKSVKDQDISRNLPGKVKLAAPNLNKKK